MYYQTDPLVRKADLSVSNVKPQELLREDLPPAGYCCFLCRGKYND